MKTITAAEPPGPAWLRRVLGDDFFATVIGACVTTLADMKHVGELSKLRSLGAFGVPITDADLERVGELSQLKSLNLSFTNITDAGLKNLKSLSQLEDFSIDVRRGEIVGLTGLLGMGHEQAPHLLFGSQRADSGDVNIGGRDYRSVEALNEVIMTHLGIDDALVT